MKPLILYGLMRRDPLRAGSSTARHSIKPVLASQNYSQSYFYCTFWVIKNMSSSAPIHRMKLHNCLLEVLCIEVRVNFRSGNRFMAEQILYNPEIGTTFYEVRGK